MLKGIRAKIAGDEIDPVKTIYVQTNTFSIDNGFADYVYPIELLPDLRLELIEED